MSVRTPTRLAGAAVRWRAAAAPGLVLGAAGAVVGYLAAVDPNQPGHYPTCPFLAVTGEYCPGCGSLRAIHALTDGRLAEAAGLNLLVVAAVPLLAVLWLRWLVVRLTGAPRPRPAPAVAIWALAALVLVFWVVRNLPLGAGLAP